MALTEPIVNLVTDLIGGQGVPMVFALMTLESAAIPVPSEVVQMFGGFLVGQGRAGLVPIIAAGVLGNVLGSWIAYWVGMTKGREWLLRWKWLHVTPARLDTADRWFERYGDRAVLIGRLLPVIRTFISLPAGVARMPFWRFTVFTTIGCIPWVTGLTLLGKAAGDNWSSVRDRLAYLDYAIAAAIVGTVIYLVIRHRRARAVGGAS